MDILSIALESGLSTGPGGAIERRATVVKITLAPKASPIVDGAGVTPQCGEWHLKRGTVNACCTTFVTGCSAGSIISMQVTYS
jgi:hypothetical protein